MRTGSPASAARKAALSAMLRMLPPATFSWASLAIVDTVDRRRLRKNVAPNGFALSGIGKRELHHESQAAQERRIESGLHVRRQDRQAAVRFHALEQVAHFDVGVAIVAVPHFAAFAEERVGFVEKQDRAAVLRRVEHPAQVLFGFADVLAHHRGQIDPIEIEMELAEPILPRPWSCRCRSRRRTAR